MSQIEELLKKEEGWEPSAYQDSLGYWTIGYGKLIDKRKGGGITKEEGLYLLRNEIARKSNELFEALPWAKLLDETRQTVLIAMAFQMGVDGVLKFRNTLNALMNGDWAKAAAGIRASRWARQTPARAERMARAIETGELEC